MKNNLEKHCPIEAFEEGLEGAARIASYSGYALLAVVTKHQRARQFTGLLTRLTSAIRGLTDQPCRLGIR